VSVWAEEMSPICVVPNVSALEESVYLASTDELAGCAAATGVAVPASATTSGLVIASLSMVRLPVSWRTAPEVPEAISSIGA
jgi:hypothetical protein